MTHELAVQAMLRCSCESTAVRLFVSGLICAVDSDDDFYIGLGRGAVTSGLIPLTITTEKNQ